MNKYMDERENSKIQNNRVNYYFILITKKTNRR